MMKKFILIIAFATGAFCTTAQTPSTRDKKFVETAAADNSKEIRLGELAQKNASSAEIKSFGQKLIADHSKSNEELKPLASRKNIVIPTQPDKKNQKIIDKLAKKQGRDFDKAFAKYMVKDHKKAVCLFKKQQKKGDDEELKTFAAKTLPTLEHHKEMAKELCMSVKKT